MALSGWGALAVILSVLAAPLALPQDDAGTGGDAPDAPHDAHVLEPGRAYHGTLAPPDDADWYRLRGTPSDPACYESRFTATGLANATLSLSPDLSLAVTQRAWPVLEVVLALATPSPQGVWLGLDAASTKPLDDVAAGAYDLRLERLARADLGDGDGGSGKDAGETMEDALPTGPGCIGGTLDGLTGDLVDLFTFEASEGDRATLSLANGVNRGTVLKLISPSGEETTHVDPGDVTGQLVNETGIWTLSVSHRAPTPGEYIVGLSVDRVGPPQPPCEPHCRSWW